MKQTKIRAQIAVALNLDKCIGCHACSVTCKTVWTSREGMEYALFNNVETKPDVGYPREWENQDKWNGGWRRKPDGKLEPRIGGKMKVLMSLFANPNLPQIDDYYEPFTFDYEHLQKAPEMKTAPVACPHSLITGQRMEKIEWCPNWKEILGGEFAKRSHDYNFEEVQKDIYGQFENTFLMYDGSMMLALGECRNWKLAIFDDDTDGLLPRLVPTRYGFHIVSIEQRVPGETVPFESVHEQIADYLQARVEREAVRQYVTMLSRKSASGGQALNPLLQ